MAIIGGGRPKSESESDDDYYFLAYFDSFNYYKSAICSAVLPSSPLAKVDKPRPKTGNLNPNPGFFMIMGGGSPSSESELY